MNRDDIIRMAKEAGFGKTRISKYKVMWSIKDEETNRLERFASLAAAAERKFWMEQIKIECNEAVLAEREACAKLLESRISGANELMDATREMEAYAIRARMR